MKTLLDTKLHQLRTFDKEIKKRGHVLIGIDEAGRGPLCGPVVAAAVKLPEFNGDPPEILNFLDDSKKFSGKEAKREELYEYIISSGAVYSIAEGSIEDIEEFNIFQTTYKTMFKAYQGVIDQLEASKHQVLVDGTKTIKYIDEKIPQVAVTKGDGKSASIAAASILAKVYRDRIMLQLAEQYPQYGWDKNKGYGTKHHVEAIRQYGRCKYHRPSFKVKGLDYEAP